MNGALSFMYDAPMGILGTYWCRVDGNEIPLKHVG